jgi:LEA14-like dessication related protein
MTEKPSPTFRLLSKPGFFSKGLLFPLVLFFLFAVCACSPSYKNPQVELRKVRIIQLTAEAVVLEGTLDLYNPNDLALRFSGYAYALQVRGRKLVTGESKDPFEVGGRKHSIITLPAFIRFEDLSALLDRDLLTRDIPYGLSGTVYFKTFFGTTSLVFSHQGTFTLSEFLRDKARELLSRS